MTAAKTTGNGVPATARLRLRYRKIEALLPHARNARKHDDAQVAQIASMIREVGFLVPVVVNPEGTILAGHGRVLAARKLGMPEVPTVATEELTESQQRLFMLADNRLGELAGWNQDLLAIEVSEMHRQWGDLKLAGFEGTALERLLSRAQPRQEGETDPDNAPEPEPAAVSRRGDLWLLGDHRVLCGDSTNPVDVERLCVDWSPVVMVTDPPYGTNYDPGWRDAALMDDKKRAKGRVKHDDRYDWTEAWQLFAGDVVYVWHGGRFAGPVQAHLEAAGFEIRCQIIWAKTAQVIGRGDYHWQHEPCWYAVRKGRPSHWCGDRSQKTVWTIDHRKSESGHSTQKPVECMRRPLENNTAPGQGVYDPFLGSGTTLIAAQETGRVCRGLEIEPRYVDVIVRRWQQFTGQAAVDAQGATFDETARARERRSRPPSKRRKRKETKDEGTKAQCAAAPGA